MLLKLVASSNRTGWCEGIIYISWRWFYCFEQLWVSNDGWRSLRVVIWNGHRRGRFISTTFTSVVGRWCSATGIASTCIFLPFIARTVSVAVTGVGLIYLSVISVIHLVVTSTSSVCLWLPAASVAYATCRGADQRYSDDGPDDYYNHVIRSVTSFVRAWILTPISRRIAGLLLRGRGSRFHRWLRVFEFLL